MCKIKSKTKKNTMNEKGGNKKKQKSIQIQITKQKCILKLFFFNLFHIHLMNILKQTLVYL
jgi:hypothetical protein